MLFLAKMLSVFLAKRLFVNIDGESDGDLLGSTWVTSAK